MCFTMNLENLCDRGLRNFIPSLCWLCTFVQLFPTLSLKPSPQSAWKVDSETPIICITRRRNEHTPRNHPTPRTPPLCLCLRCTQRIWPIQTPLQPTRSGGRIPVLVIDISSNHLATDQTPHAESHSSGTVTSNSLSPQPCKPLRCSCESAPFKDSRVCFDLHRFVTRNFSSS